MAGEDKVKSVGYYDREAERLKRKQERADNRYERKLDSISSDYEEKSADISDEDDRVEKLEQEKLDAETAGKVKKIATKKESKSTDIVNQQNANIGNRAKAVEARFDKKKKEIGVVGPLDENTQYFLDLAKKRNEQRKKEAEKAKADAEAAAEEKDASSADTQNADGVQAETAEAQQAQDANVKNERVKPISSKDAREQVRKERAENALRDFSWYTEFNSYGKEFNADQLQNSMQPEDIRAFQKSVGLPMTGIVDRRTYAMLRSEYDKRDDLKNQFNREYIDDEIPSEEEKPDTENEGGEVNSEQSGIAQELKDWVERNRSSEPKDFEEGIVKELQTIMRKYRTILGRNPETKQDDIFGRQTMTDFYDLLMTNPNLKAAVERAGVKFNGDGILERTPYAHYMDELNANYDKKRNEYERNWNLRQQQRNAKFQRFADMTHMIKDMASASGGAKISDYDSESKYKNVYDAMKENQDRFNELEDDRREDYLKILKENEDERRKRSEYAYEKAYQKEEDEEDRKSDSEKNAVEKYKSDNQVLITKMQTDASKIASQANITVAKKNYEGKKLDNETKIKVQQMKDISDEAKTRGAGKSTEVMIDGALVSIPDAFIISAGGQYNLKRGDHSASHEDVVRANIAMIMKDPERMKSLQTLIDNNPDVIKITGGGGSQTTTTTSEPEDIGF